MTPTRAFWSLLVNLVRHGLIATGVILLLGYVGILEDFGGREIVTGVISVSALVVYAVVFAAAQHALGRSLEQIPLFDDAAESWPDAPPGAAGDAARRDVRHLLRKTAWGAAAGVGAMTGIALRLFAAVASQLNLRPIFINATPELYDFLRTAAFGCYVVGVAAMAAPFVPPGLRRALRWGALWVVALGLLGEHLLLVLGHNGLEALVKGWFFAGKSLTVAGAMLTFLAASGLALLWQRYGATTRAAADALPPARRRRLGLLGWIAALILVLALPRLVGPYHSEVMNQVGLFIMMGLGLNIVVGFAGMLDLGYVAFFALGAYTVGALTSPESFLATEHGARALGFWEALPVAVLVAFAAGVMLGVPVLRMRGDYLAIVTLGFGEIIRLLALSEWLRPYVGGAQGIAAIPPIVVPWVGFGARCASVGMPVCLVRLPIAGPDKPQLLFYLILAACLVAGYVALRLQDSRFGRAWMAMREDEDVAEAMGIHLVSTKLLAFAAGAALSGMSGTLFAAKLGSIYPHSFGLLISINILALIIVGGMGSIPGVIVGALVLVGLPELLREFAEYRLMVYGAVLVAMMLRRPEGLVPSHVRRRELLERSVASPDNDIPLTRPAGGTS